MLSFLRNLIPERSALRLQYHKISAFLAALWYRFPAQHLTVIGVTGTSGKSTTVELIHFLLQSCAKPCGALSSIQFHISDEIRENETLRTTLRPWKTQKLLREMVSKKCEYAVIEVSSHAIDQHRLTGINVDIAVLTNIYDNEHLDYHKTVADYVRTKQKLFRNLNAAPRKPNIAKTAILNRDDERFELFDDLSFDKKWSYSRRAQGDVLAENPQFFSGKMTFSIRVPNNNLPFEVPMVGSHNLENIMAAITTAMACEVDLPAIQNALQHFFGVPSRLEPMTDDQDFSVLVDHTYKPSALQAVLSSLKPLTEGRLIVVWGGAGGRGVENWQASGKALTQYADEIILTTDDPYDEDPRMIARIVREVMNREEGNGFFEIEDRYEAIRYAIFSAQEGDTILVAGRGNEKIQTIGKHKIPFDDREVCKEILGISDDKITRKQDNK